MLIRRIVRHELRDVLRDGRFRWASAIVMVLLIAAVVTGAAQQRAVSAQHESAARLMRDTWLSQPSKDPHTAAHYGAYAFKPRGPLTLVDSGVNDYTGVAAFLEAHKQNEFQFRPAQDRASIARLGRLTAAVTLQFLVPILIMLLAFTKFAGEREDGTLRQLLAAGVPSRTLALGKAAGVAAALALVLIPATTIGAAALALSSSSDALGQQTFRVAGLIVVYTLSFATVTMLSLTVSAVVRRPGHALAVLVAFWAANALLAPRLASDVARRLDPVPSAFELAESVERDVYDGLPIHTYNVRRAADLRARLFAQYHVVRVEDLPVNFRGVDYLEREAHANDVWDAHYREVWNAFGRQNRTQQLAGFAAPLMSVRYLSMALTGTDWFHHQDFAAAAEAYRRQFVLAMNSTLAYGGSSKRQGAYAAEATTWSAIPPFDYRLPSVVMAMSQVSISVIALFVWTAASGVALLMASRRITVE
jgi:ABC-2 type transport system permease protein